MSNSRQWKITYQDSCLPGWSESCEKRNCKLKRIPSVRELVNWTRGPALPSQARTTLLGKAAQNPESWPSCEGYLCTAMGVIGAKQA